MSLARAFTTRKPKRPDITEPQGAAGMARAYSTRTSGRPLFARHQISGPVELLSTTNMLSYNAPDIEGTRRIIHKSSSSTSSPTSPTVQTAPTARAASTSSSSTAHSQPLGIDSDGGNVSPASLTDASSVTDSGPPSPEPNRLSTYFQAPGTKEMARSVSSSSLRSKASHEKTYSIESAPSIPQRAPSHSKRAHQDVARKRSLNHHGSVPSLRSSRETPRGSAEVFTRRSVEPNHPFGKELDQLIEVAEEFNGAVRNIELDEDYQFMQSKGLGRFGANDYMLEISGLFSSRFEDQIVVVEPTWI
jgi:hypothetical protein